MNNNNNKKTQLANNLDLLPSLGVSGGSHETDC